MCKTYNVNFMVNVSEEALDNWVEDQEIVTIETWGVTDGIVTLGVISGMPDAYEIGKITKELWALSKGLKL